MSAVGEAYGTGSFESGSLALNARMVPATDPAAYIPVRITDGGSFTQGSAGSDNAFGDVVRVGLNPEVQIDFAMGLIEGIARQETRQDASIGLSGTVAQLNSGTGSFSFASVESHARIKYRPGQGILARWTALYDEPTEGIRAFSGMSTRTSALQIGYSGSEFGILHQPHSEPHLFTFNVTTASTTAETAVFTFSNPLGPNTVSVPLTNNASLIQTANEIAAADWSQIHYHGYNIQSSGSTITFIHRDPEEHSEIINFTATTMSGTFGADILSGDFRNDNFITSSSFSIDKLDGTGPSGMKLNPQNGNVYQVAFQYLGYGNSVFSIEDDESGQFIPIHVIEWSNRENDPVMQTTSLPLQWVIEHTGSSDVSNKFIKGASGAAFIQGTVNNNLIRRFTYTKTTLALTTTNTHIFSVKSLLSFNEKINLGTARLVLMSLTSEDQGAVIELHLNAEITTPNWSKVKSGSSVMMFDTTGTVGINGSIILSTGVGQGDSKDYDLTPFNIQMHGIPDQDTISIIARSVKTTTDFVVTLVWEELV